MIEREERADAFSEMIAADVQRAAARMQPGESLQVQMTYKLFLELRSFTTTIKGDDGAPMHFGEARVLINDTAPTGELSYTVLIVTKHRKLEGII